VLIGSSYSKYQLASEAEEQQVLRAHLDLLNRSHRLSQAGKLPCIVFADDNRVSISTSQVNPYGSRQPMRWKDFEALIESAEVEAGWAERKPPQVETKTEFQKTSRVTKRA
jgi:hypothetical protein